MNEEMMKAMAGKQMPEMAIVESNTLAAMGLRQLLGPFFMMGAFLALSFSLS